MVQRVSVAAPDCSSPEATVRPAEQSTLRRRRPRTGRDSHDGEHDEPSSGVRLIEGRAAMRATGAAGLGYASFAELREGVVFRRLRLLKFLGAGATAQVWMAKNLVTGRKVAVKISSRVHDDADPAAMRDVQRFFYEARLGARLSRMTPHVVATIDAGVQSGLPYLVMELGEPLTRRRMPPLDAARVITHVARALEAAHLSSVIHRDVKPANILKMSPRSAGDSIFKLGDYGIARPFYEGGPVAAARADEIVLIGTPAYMCPDAICGEAPARGSGDIWALAVTAYELATGTLPFDAHTWFHLAEQIVKGNYRPLPEEVIAQAPDLPAVFARAFAASPHARFSSALALAAAYAKALGSEPARGPTSMGSGQVVGA